MMIDALAGNGQFQNKYKSLIQKKEIENETALLVKPQTFMNLSGQAVREIAHFYKIPLDSLLVIHDDKDLPFGTMKFQKSRGPGGHNGVKNIHQELNSKDYTRLKMGIGIEKNQADLKKTAVKSKPLLSFKEERKHTLQNYDTITWRSILEDPSKKLNKIDTDYVLSPFSKKEKERLADFLNKGVKAIECFIKQGFHQASNQFNSKTPF